MIAAVGALPLFGCAPLQPPVAVQAVTLAEPHVNVDEPPMATAVGAALRVTLGVVTIVTVVEPIAVPPAPEQLSV